MFVFFLDLAEAREDVVHPVGLIRIAHRVLEMFQFVVQVADAPAAEDRFVEDRAPGALLDVLPEVADAQLLRNGHLAFVRRFLAGDHAEQRRLARSVRSDQSDVLAGVQLKGRVDEENLTSVLLGHPAQGDQKATPFASAISS